MNREQITDRFLRRVTSFINEKKNSGWMQNMKLKTGALSGAPGVPEQDDIPLALLQKKKRELQKAAEGYKKLSRRDLTLLGRINLAITLKKAKK